MPSASGCRQLASTNPAISAGHPVMCIRSCAQDYDLLVRCRNVLTSVKPWVPFQYYGNTTVQEKIEICFRSSALGCAGLFNQSISGDRRDVLSCPFALPVLPHSSVSLIDQWSEVVGMIDEYFVQITTSFRILSSSGHCILEGYVSF